MPGLKEIFEQDSLAMNPFNGLENEKQQSKFCKENFKLVVSQIYWRGGGGWGQHILLVPVDKDFTWRQDGRSWFCGAFSIYVQRDYKYSK